jgi:hypothetical protein
LIVFATLAATAQQDAPANPNFRDTTIKTRVTRGLSMPLIKTLRLKGHGNAPRRFLTLPPYT